MIVCTGQSTVAQRVRGLRLGADDWVTKPCHPEELIARVEAVARRRRHADAALGSRTRRSSPGRSNSGPTSSRRSRTAARSISRGASSSSSQMLAAAQGRVLEREEIYQCVWGYTMAHGDRSVDVFVRKLAIRNRQRVQGHSVHVLLSSCVRRGTARPVSGAPPPGRHGRAVRAVALRWHSGILRRRARPALRATGRGGAACVPTRCTAGPGWGAAVGVAGPAPRRVEPGVALITHRCSEGSGEGLGSLGGGPASLGPAAVGGVTGAHDVGQDQVVPAAGAADLHHVHGEVGVDVRELLELLGLAGEPAACFSASPKIHETRVSRSLRQTGQVCSWARRGTGRRAAGRGSRRRPRPPRPDRRGPRRAAHGAATRSRPPVAGSARGQGTRTARDRAERLGPAPPLGDGSSSRVLQTAIRCIGSI